MNPIWLLVAVVALYKWVSEPEKEIKHVDATHSENGGNHSGGNGGGKSGGADSSTGERLNEPKPEPKPEPIIEPKPE